MQRAADVGKCSLHGVAHKICTLCSPFWRCGSEAGHDVRSRAHLGVEHLSSGKRAALHVESLPGNGGCAQIHGQPCLTWFAFLNGRGKNIIKETGIVCFGACAFRRNSQDHGVMRIVAAGQTHPGGKLFMGEDIPFPQTWSGRGGKKAHPAQTAVSDARAQRARRQMPPSPKKSGEIYGSERRGDFNFPAFTAR